MNAQSASQTSPDDQARYLSILDSTPDLICRFRPDTTLTFVNKAYAEYFQSEVDELLGRKFLDLVPEEAQAEILSHIAQIKPDHSSDSYEHGVTTPDGTVAWQYWTDVGIFDDDENLIEIQSIGRDITYVHRLQQELEAKNDELSRRDAELSLVLDSIPSRVWYKDDLNGILRLNEAAARSMGLRKEQVEGQNTYDLFGPMAKKYHDDDLAVIETGKPSLGIIERYTPDGGSDGWVTTDKIPFPDPVTGDRRLLVVATDITELKQQEAQLQIINRNLDHFASLASHDLKAPLRHIMVYAEMFGEDFAEAIPDEGREMLDRISHAATKMRGIIDTFLTFARSSPNDATLEPVDVTKVLVETVADMQQDIDQRGASVTLPDGPAWVMGEHGLLGQLFQNLIDNALKFARDEEPCRIDFAAQASGGFWTVTITDNGVGIAPANRDKIFDLFARGKPAHGETGSGIGLALCRRIAVLHGGSITVDPDFEEGTRMVLTLEQAKTGLARSDRP
jgi:PAS domain S-box-containing protein